MIYLGVLLMTLLGAAGAFFLKRGMDRADKLLSALREPWIYLGGCFYAAGAGMNVLLLRVMDYSVVYPMTAVTYIWSMLLSAAFLGEKITGRKVAGVAAIVAGVIMISLQ